MTLDDLNDPVIGMLVSVFVVAGVVLGTPIWLCTSFLADHSLRAYPLLVPSSPRRVSWWAGWVWMPILGPLTYAAALATRRLILGRHGWQEARSRPAPIHFTPPRPAPMPYPQDGLSSLPQHQR